MTNETLALIFLLIGTILIILEFSLPTNFELFAFGLGSYTLAALTYLKINVWIQILAFLLVVALTIFISYSFTKKTTQRSKDFSPFAIKGKEGRVVMVEGDKVVVRVEGEDWLVNCGDRLSVGDKVIVLEVKGNILEVKKIS